jgi:hypothetical protein
MKKRFREQRNSAKRRGISWRLTYEQWLKIWSDSGKLARRGNRKGNYVMARFDDKGSYAVGNVKIITCQQNNRDGLIGKKRNRKNRNNIAQGIKAYWANLTPEQRAARGRAVSEGQLRTGSNLKSWKNPKKRRRHHLALKRMWAKLTPKQRAIRGRAISKGKRQP